MLEGEIEKGVPIPPLGKPLQYDFSGMDVGDSKLFKGAKANSVQCCASLYGKKHNMKFTTRSVTTGVRVWRVK